jgi:putative intracellular protease/amidase
MRRVLLNIGLGLVATIAIIAIALPTILHSAGIHPDYHGEIYENPGKRALVITTSHAVLNTPEETTGDATGVMASEMTHPYYTFLDSGMQVDLASINGGAIPVDPQTLSRPIISPEDKRYLNDPILQAKVNNSIKIDDVDMSQYDVVFIAGGWGAAYDLAQSEVLAEQISNAYYNNKQAIIGSVCHGALGLVKAKDKQGNLLITGRKMTGVTDKQIKQLGIEITPLHPETELRKAGAIFESQTKFIDFFATHVAVDDEQRFITGQNQNSGLEAAHTIMGVLAKR